jgi:hypothetical protein
MKKPKDNSSAVAREDELARQQRIREGTAAIDSQFGQFDDEFFKARQQSYLDYATPQLNDQYEDALKELRFSLDRSGLPKSSVRAQREGDLRKLYAVNKQQVADRALSQGTQARNSVEEARADLIRTLNSTADATGAASSAINRAQILSQPDAYSPLGQLFTSFTNTLGQQAGLERVAAYAPNSGLGPRYNTGLFGANRNAVKSTS